MKCNHEWAEMDTACADGLCPLCLYTKNKQLKEMQRKVLKLLRPSQCLYAKAAEVEIERVQASQNKEAKE